MPIITKCTYIHTYLIDHSPWGFSGPINQRYNRTQQLQLLRIPTGQRQTSWLFTSATGKLNQGLPGSNSMSGQSGSWNPGSPDLKASALTTGPHCLLYSRCISVLISAFRVSPCLNPQLQHHLCPERLAISVTNLSL